MAGSGPPAQLNHSGPPHPPNGHIAHLVRNIALFVVGAFLLVVEIEFRDQSRIWVIVLALVLMGIVTAEQVIDWLKERTPPR